MGRRCSPSPRRAAARLNLPPATARNRPFFVFACDLTPIGEQLCREIVATDYLQTDDTTITVLDERGGSFKGRVWTYLDPLTKQVRASSPSSDSRSAIDHDERRLPLVR